jgi:hypothetical protein
MVQRYCPHSLFTMFIVSRTLRISRIPFPVINGRWPEKKCDSFELSRSESTF